MTNRTFRGIPSLALAPQGRLWANWNAGVTPGEDENHSEVLSTSGDGGATWTEVLVIDSDGDSDGDPDGPDRVLRFDPQRWVSPDRRLFLFWVQMGRTRSDKQLGVWCIETKQPDAARPVWSQSRRVGDGVMMGKPLVVLSGEWVLPVSKWKEHDTSAQRIVSVDEGKTWKRRGGS